MFTEIFGFECRYQLRSPLFIITALLFFAFAFFAMASDSVHIGGDANNLNLNAPFTLIQSHTILSIIATFAKGIHASHAFLYFSFLAIVIHENAK